MQDAIRAERMRKTFRVGFLARRVEAVRDASIDVRRGEVFGLLGPNGAGKTTLLKMLLGFVRPDGGSARVDGEPAGTRAARRNVGYLPENPALYEFLTGPEYLVLAGRLAGLDATAARRRAGELLELVGLSGRADRRIRKFSKGMVQRLGLAQALVGSPSIVVLDEPMSGLDPIGRKDVRDLIFHLRDEGRTVLFSTHILSDVEAICDRVAIVVGGRVTDCGALSQIVSPGVRSVEVRVRGLATEVVDNLRALGAKAEERDREVVLSFATEELAREGVRTAVLAGGQIVSLAPHRQTLEELFVERARSMAGNG